jgi:flagellar biosynthesis/type III secretory pathway M-ring protein FliF/YscJ
MIAAAALWFRTNPRNAVFIGILLLVLVAAVGLYLKGRSDESDKRDAARAVEVQDALASDAKADEKSAQVAQRNAEQAAKAKEELINVVASVPDEAPDAVAVAAACYELRHRPGVADLPACKLAAANRSAGAPH